MNIGLLVIYPKVKWSILPNTACKTKKRTKKIEVKNYLNQSVKLSEKAQEVVDNLKLGNIGQSVIVTLTLLLLFLNIVLLTRKKVSSH